MAADRVSRPDAGIDKTASALIAPVKKCPFSDNVFLTVTTSNSRTVDLDRAQGL
jgi:hypothetical protein